MNEFNNPFLTPVPENPKAVSFSNASAYLGLDDFTFYSLIQRTEVPYDVDEGGEFVVSQEDLDGLIAPKE